MRNDQFLRVLKPNQIFRPTDKQFLKCRTVTKLTTLPNGKGDLSNKEKLLNLKHSLEVIGKWKTSLYKNPNLRCTHSGVLNEWIVIGWLKKNLSPRPDLQFTILKPKTCMKSVAEAKFSKQRTWISYSSQESRRGQPKYSNLYADYTSRSRRMSK